ncbi:unnamed protein product [Miscanthus lutarioriparius]|uniref:DUF659 domain-containing protein n=1 Tax=Miscanthus lutarioriparius TaxID=422564 RepID=A0A811P5Y7_9POAL|nr:unnamed protein product [Miscanthus lutarioriparius]
MSCSDDDVDRRCANVEVYMPLPDLEEGVLDSSVGSDPTTTASSSTLEDIPSLIERDITKLPPDLAAQAVDKKRKARSQDPGWKYGWWPDPSKDFVQCIFCRKQNQQLKNSPGQYRSPSYHDVRTPLLERAVNKTTELRKKHEEAWKEYGCTIMSDGWTDISHRHLINFLANSLAGTFFLGSVDASSEIANANMLAGLLEKQIDKVGKEHVVQIVTNNGANFKAVGRLLMERIPHLFWTPCAAHCLDLLLEDIGKIKEFHICINMAQNVTRFIYKHGRVLDLMRNKIGGDLMRPTITRFATSFLTLAAIKDSLQRKPDLLKEVLKYYDNRWENQMEQQLYGAALYLNPSKFFALKEKDRRQAGRPRIMFNQVMWKMVTDDEEQNKISKQTEDYERAEGESFSQPGAIRDRDRKNYKPVQEGGGDAMTWAVVDEAIGATQGLEGRNLPRAAATRAAVAAPVRCTYARNRKRPRNTVTQDIDEVDDEDQDQHVDSAIAMEEDEESVPTETGDGPTGDGDGCFTFNVDLLN